jgi:tryptophan-rich sensory protein
MDILALVRVMEAAGRPPPLPAWEEAWNKISTFVSELPPLEKWHFVHFGRQHPWGALAFVVAVIVVVCVFAALSKQFSKK